jgi:hypothetical protein
MATEKNTMSLSKRVRSERGYLLNTYTHVRYPFQFNPTEITDTKTATWGKREGVSPKTSPENSGQTASSSASSGYKSPAERLARRFTRADFHKFDAEGERSLTIQFKIDGREQLPDEPAWRRNSDGDVLSDIAFLRSLVYPKAGKTLQDMLALTSGQGSSSYSEEWFNEPPLVILSFGDLTMEAYVTSVQITETLFNDKLNPMRADVTISLTERVDSFSFVVDAITRLRRASPYIQF